MNESMKADTSTMTGPTDVDVGKYISCFTLPTYLLYSPCPHLYFIFLAYTTFPYISMPLDGSNQSTPMMIWTGPTLVQLRNNIDDEYVMRT
jgi:hypothetical protein